MIIYNPKLAVSTDTSQAAITPTAGNFLRRRRSLLEVEKSLLQRKLMGGKKGEEYVPPSHLYFEVILDKSNRSESQEQSLQCEAGHNRLNIL